MIRTYLIKRFEDAGFTYVKPPSTYAKRIAVGNIPLFLTMHVVKDRLFALSFIEETDYITIRPIPVPRLSRITEYMAYKIKSKRTLFVEFP